MDLSLCDLDDQNPATTVHISTLIQDANLKLTTLLSLEGSRSK